MMIRKICFMAVMVLAIMTSTVFAMIPDTMDVQTAMNRSYETLLINSIDGMQYNVFMISDNAKFTENYLWEKNWLYVGDFYVYLARVGDETAFLQKDINPFKTVDTDGMTPNGCFVITSKTGMPDILENISRSSGGGGYKAAFYAIKDNRLHKIQFMDQHRRMESGYFSVDEYREREAARYLDDGTFYIHWWTNAWPNVGTYKAVYMFDYQNLIMIKAYTYKKGPHDDDYHEM